MPYRQNRRNRLKRKRVNTPQPITMGEPSQVIVKSQNGGVGLGVRRVAPFSTKITEQIGEGKTKRFRMMIRLTPNEIAAFEECRCRIEGLKDISQSALCKQIIRHWIDNNPPYKDSHRNHKYLWNDRNRSVVYKNGSNILCYGHVRMMDYDPINQRRLTKLTEFNCLDVDYKFRSDVQSYIHLHGIKISHLYNFCFTDFFLKSHPHFDTPHWHDESIIEHWARSHEIFQDMKRIKVLGDERLTEC